MPEKQNIVMVQNNNGCGCGSLIAAIILIGLSGYLVQEFGPIVFAIIGFFLGAWGGLKISGVSIEELNHIDTGEYDSRQIRGAIFMMCGGVFFALAGWGVGQEFIKEMDDNARILLNIVSRFRA